MMTDEQWDAVPGMLKRIIHETDHGEWWRVGEIYICLVWTDFHYTHFFWEAWRGAALGWAEKIACDTAAHYHHPEDAIAAARRQLVLMESRP